MNNFFDFLIASQLDPNNPLNVSESDNDEIDYEEGEYWLEHDNGSTASIFDADSSDFENWHDDLDD